MLKSFILISLLLATGNSWAYDYTVEITEDQLQQQLIKMMPVKREQMFVTVTLSNPVLELGIEGNKVGVNSDLEMTAPGGIKGTGHAKIVGNISYKKENGNFYFYKPTIAELEIDQVPAQFHDNVKQLAQYALTNSLGSKPIFTLQDDNQQQKLAKSMLKSVDIKPGKILITLAIAEN